MPHFNAAVTRDNHNLAAATAASGSETAGGITFKIILFFKFVNLQALGSRTHNRGS